ncbi:hypothetical protein [Nocardia sp. XZ_19_369]|uniref:hypothetical protein n=1 Tax=Nocardia sp. XZ_19_369 TaxID=2769487 RepID=UPI00188DD64D|nr:hypothetical protein [Nocardia sp. XZ_19_369]
MDNEPGKATVDVDQLIQLFTGVLQQYRQPDSPETNTLHDGNDLTLSIFSELQYALQSRNLASKGPVAQSLPAQVDVQNKMLFFKRRLPRYAERVVVIHRGNLAPEVHYVYDQESRDGGNGGDCDTPTTFDLAHPHEAIAVQIQDCHERIRLVSFVTFAPIDTGGGSRVAANTVSPQAM